MCTSSQTINLSQAHGNQKTIHHHDDHVQHYARNPAGCLQRATLFGPGEQGATC